MYQVAGWTLVHDTRVNCEYNDNISALIIVEVHITMMITWPADDSRVDTMT